MLYNGDAGTKTNSLDLYKILFNSVLSRNGATFITYDISNYYLATPLNYPKYIKIKLTDIPQYFINEYNLHDFVHNGWVYFEIHNGVYDLPQSGCLAQQLLPKRLHKHVYYQYLITPGMWRHQWQPYVFTLIVDNFGVEYVSKYHANHLRNALKDNYEVTVSEKGDLYAGIKL